MDENRRRKPRTLSPAARVLTIEQFSAEYGPGFTRVYEMMGSGELAAIKVGKRTLIRREDAEAWLASRPVFKPQRERVA